MKQLLIGVTTGVLVAFSGCCASASPEHCLRWVDIDQFSKIAPDRVVAHTRNLGSYLIKFSTVCDYQKFIGWYFVVDPSSRLECVTSQSVFYVRHAGSCGVSEISPMPSGTQAH